VLSDRLWLTNKQGYLDADNTTKEYTLFIYRYFQHWIKSIQSWFNSANLEAKMDSSLKNKNCHLKIKTPISKPV